MAIDWSRFDGRARTSKGIVKIRCKNRWELQCDLATAKLLAVNYRRSDFIESLHDGSFFTEGAKLFAFLPNGLALLLLWSTGVYLWWLPWGARRAARQRRTPKK